MRFGQLAMIEGYLIKYLDNIIIYNTMEENKNNIIVPSKKKAIINASYYVVFPKKGNSVYIFERKHNK